MSTWFTEHPTNAYIVIGGIALVFLIVTLATRRWAYLLVVFLMGLFAGGVWLIDYLVITDREQVEFNVGKMMAAVEKHDLEEFGKFVSEDFDTNGVNKAAVMVAAKEAIPGIKEVNMRNLQVEPRDNGLYYFAECTVAPVGSFRNQPLEGEPYTLRLEFAKDKDGQWRARRVEVYDAVGQRRYYP